jgi:predicted  nucleic acid-binding Zn-ribbon protein
MRDKWSYLTKHVRSEKEALRIRGNLRLAKLKHGQKHGAENSTIFDATTSNPEFQSEKDSLIYDIKTTQKQLKKVRKKSMSAETSAGQFRKDCALQNERIARLQAQLNEGRKVAHFLRAFAHKCDAEIDELVALEMEMDKLRTQGGLFRSQHSEKLFADDDNHAVDTLAQVFLLQIAI